MRHSLVDNSGDGLTYEGEHYTCTTAPLHDLVQHPGGSLTLHFGWEPSFTCNDCPHGHPHEVPGAERVASSVQEAVERGWLTRDA